MGNHIQNLDDVIMLYKKEHNLFSVTIELTSNCNWHCVHCYIDDYGNKGFTYSNFECLLLELRKMGTYEIILTGGEIFTNKKCIEMIYLARKLFFNVVLYSNISMLNDEMIEKLSTLNLGYISCTLFSLQEEVHDSITGISGSLRKCLKNIELMKKKKIPIEIKMPVINRNLHSIDELHMYCNNNNFKFKVDTQIVPQRDGNIGNIKESLSLEQLVKIQSKIDRINGVDLSANSLQRLTCESLSMSVYINSFGSIQPCSLYNVSFGNVNISSIKELWNRFSKSSILSYSPNQSENCRNCDLSSYCVQCPGIAFSENRKSTSCSFICKKTALARSLNR